MLKPPPLTRLPAWVVNGVFVTLGLAVVQTAIGRVAGEPAAQVAIGTAVCASLADVVTTTDRVARRVLVAALASTAAAALFLAARPHGMLLIPAVAAIVLGAMLLLSWGPKAGSVAFATTLSLVFAMAAPAGQGLTWSRLGWGLAGSLGYWVWAVATAWLLQPTWRRFALVAVADGLARLLAAIGQQIGHGDQPAPAARQSRVFEAEAALAERLQSARDLLFVNQRDPTARLETALLLHLIDLRDLAMASNLGAGSAAATPALRRRAEVLGRLVEEIASALALVAAELRAGRGAAATPAVRGPIASLLAELEAVEAVGPGIGNTLVKTKLALLDAIQATLASPSEAIRTADRDADLQRYVSPDEWRLSAVAANLRPEAPVLRHAVRTALTATLAYAVTRTVPWTPHPQWVLLTVVAVMQGNLAQTLLRRNARLLGTLAGCALVLALSASSSPGFLSTCFLVAAGVAHAFFGVHYAVTAGAAAVMAVLQAHAGTPVPGFFETFERFLDTVLGALLGWAATYALPTWERQALPRVLKQAMAALQAYAVEATSPHLDASGMPRFARQRAYDAIRALAAIRSRSLAEPQDVRVPLEPLAAWLAAAYGLMAHLSNLRLALVLNGRPQEDAALSNAMAETGRNLEAVLAGAPDAPRPPLAPPQAIVALPHVAWRSNAALVEAGRLALEAARIAERIRA